MPRRTLLLLCALGALTVAPELRAQSENYQAVEATLGRSSGELRSMRELGMAGAFAGGGSGVGSLFHNPATLVSAAVYEIGAGYQFDMDSGIHAMGAAVSDAKTNPSLAAGFSYSFGLGSNDALEELFDSQGDAISESDARFRGHDIRAGVAFPVIPGMVSIGAGGHHVNSRHASWTEVQERTILIQTDADAPPTTRVEITENEYSIQTKGFTMDVGIAARLGESFMIGFAAQNLLKIDGASLGRRLEGGVGGYFEAFHLEIAWNMEQDPSKSWSHGVAVGAEYVIQTVPVRAGYRWEGLTRSNIIAAGLGIRSERWGGDIAYEQNVTHTSDRRFGATIALYF